MVDEKGQPTRLALSAHAWGEPVPKTMDAAKKLAAKGRALLKKYEASKKKPAKTAAKKSATKNVAGRTAARRRTPAR